jgi:NADPH:quinone reductase-like Zn-dependent oxidoreductase
MSDAETMEAWTHESAGIPSQVLTKSTLPRPRITAPTQVLVKISHCALNPGGSIIMQLLPFNFRATPAIPEMDFSGTVVEAGSAVPDARNIEPSAKVFGSIPLGQHVKSTSGTLAQYVVVDHTAIVRKPASVSMREVAGLGIAGATALQLIKAAKLRNGDSVLVNGAAGGAGHLVVQMCCVMVGPSGKVVAICSKSSSSWVGSLDTTDRRPGDDVDIGSSNVSVLQIIERGQEPLVAYLSKTFHASRFDAVIDAVGIQDIFNASSAFLAEKKPYVTVGPRVFNYTYFGMLGAIAIMAKNMLWPQMLGGTPRPYVQVAVASSLEALEVLAAMMEKGRLRVHIGMVVGWGDVAKVSTLPGGM